MSLPGRPKGEFRGAQHEDTLMSTLYLWVKAFHIVFVASWFAGLFYLPRIFVNLAMVAQDSHAERERLLLMARKLYRFATLLMVPALALGWVLWWGYGVGRGPGSVWMHLKLLLVLGVIAYHLYCLRLMRGFEQFSRKHFTHDSLRPTTVDSRTRSYRVFRPNSN